MAKTLVVLGNGFDLLCGLQSSFPQFLESKYYANVINKLKDIDRKVTTDLKFPSDYDGFAIYERYKISFEEDLTFIF